jgi:hypothetical protein
MLQALFAALELQDSANLKSKGHFALDKCLVLGQIQRSAIGVLEPHFTAAVKGSFTAARCWTWP